VVDQQRGISDPVGMTGTRLEVEMYLVTVQSTAAQNLRRSVERARYRPAELVLEPLAASYAVLTDDEKELGVALVEVGGGSTGVAIFHEGKIRHLASLKYAGTHVTSDLVAGLGVTQADAERLKERHGVAYQPLVDASEMITCRPRRARGRGRRRASCCRTSSTSAWTRSSSWRSANLERAGYGGGRLPAGVVLTGGTAHLPGMVGAGARRLSRAGAGRTPEQRDFSGLSSTACRAPRYAVPVGLVLTRRATRARAVFPAARWVKSAGVERWFGPLKRWLQDFF